MAQQQSHRFAPRRRADVLRTEIISGACPPGTRTPSYRQFRYAHGMAPNTAQAAVRMLAIEGLVEIRPARGVDARDNTRDSDDQTLRAQLADLGVSLRRGKDQLAAAESMVAVLLSRLPSEERIR
jgi:DNA-binding transcriptional MocR family regulator